ncbi:unnamed protein product [Amoebophrya sp. A25]|nr:unnamed protein product [Amoebophrya sp. A25]|eukprot:GSA25T00014385001.1
MVRKRSCCGENVRSTCNAYRKRLVVRNFLGLLVACWIFLILLSYFVDFYFELQVDFVHAVEDIFHWHADYFPKYEVLSLAVVLNTVFTVLAPCLWTPSRVVIFFEVHWVIEEFVFPRRGGFAASQQALRVKWREATDTGLYAYLFAQANELAPEQDLEDEPGGSSGSSAAGQSRGRGASTSAMNNKGRKQASFLGTSASGSDYYSSKASIKAKHKKAKEPSPLPTPPNETDPEYTSPPRRANNASSDDVTNTSTRASASSAATAPGASSSGGAAGASSSGGDHAASTSSVGPSGPGQEAGEQQQQCGEDSSGAASSSTALSSEKALSGNLTTSSTPLQRVPGAASPDTSSPDFEPNNNGNGENSSDEARAGSNTSGPVSESQYSLLECSRSWRKLRKRRLKKLRESKDPGESEKADVLIREYQVKESDHNSDNADRLQRVLFLHQSEVTLLDIPTPVQEVREMAEELCAVLAQLDRPQMREFVKLYWENEYGVRAARDYLLRVCYKPPSSLQPDKEEEPEDTSAGGKATRTCKEGDKNHQGSITGGTVVPSGVVEDMSPYIAELDDGSLVLNFEVDAQTQPTLVDFVNYEETYAVGDDKGEDLQTTSQSTSKQGSQGDLDEDQSNSSSGGVMEEDDEENDARRGMSTTSARSSKDRNNFASSSTVDQHAANEGSSDFAPRRWLVAALDYLAPIDTTANAKDGQMNNDSNANNNPTVGNDTNSAGAVSKNKNVPGTSRPVGRNVGRGTLLLAPSKNQNQPHQQNQRSSDVVEAEPEDPYAEFYHSHLPDSEIYAQVRNPGEYFVPLAINECMAHAKLLGRKCLRNNGFSSHECDTILYRNNYNHLKNYQIRNARMFSPARVQKLRTM